jgi:catechol 2,3-dioxygenase-like lactoylglutathione lyase family enzyme
MMIATGITPTTQVKFHFGLWAADLDRAVSFYRAMFGQEPHKHYPDYAKFEVEDPPVVLSFLKQRAPRGNALNHLDLVVSDAASLCAVRERLAAAGFPVQADGDGKAFQVADPDGTCWTVSTQSAGLTTGASRRPVAPAVPEVEVPADGTWTHTTGEDFPARLPFADGSLDEVRLLGTLNAAAPPGEAACRLAEVRRVLRPGGRVVVRGLVGDRPYPGEADFPGLMAKIKHVPVEHEPLEALERAGLRGIEIEKLRDVSCVEDAHGVALRALTATAWRAAESGEATCQARYNGPFEWVTDDDGTAFPRGVWVRVSPDLRERLKHGTAGAQFTFPES